MKLSHFHFNLPEELLAEYPSENRDESRLMVLNRKEQTIEHKLFKDIIDYFNENDVMILNNTKVFPARLFGNKEKTGARIEVFLLRELSQDQRLWDVLVDPARKIRIADSMPSRLGPVDFELGVIAGSGTINVVASAMLPDPDDGKVSVASTKVDGMDDFLLVGNSHRYITRSDVVLRNTESFLRNGWFLDEDKAAMVKP